MKQLDGVEARAAEAVNVDEVKGPIDDLFKWLGLPWKAMDSIVDGGAVCHSNTWLFGYGGSMRHVGLLPKLVVMLVQHCGFTLVALCMCLRWKWSVYCGRWTTRTALVFTIDGLKRHVSKMSLEDVQKVKHLASTVTEGCVTFIPTGYVLVATTLNGKTVGLRKSGFLDDEATGAALEVVKPLFHASELPFAGKLDRLRRHQDELREARWVSSPWRAENEPCVIG
eukprot:250141-Amphidinium_carterae.1